jgi:hypothetical protein
MRKKRTPTKWSNPVRALRSQLRDARAIKEWRESGSPVPPPSVVKQQVVRAYAAQFDLQTFVETGTFKGDMIYAVERHFKEVHSIELGRDLFEEARQRFAGLAHIHLHHGDSATMLPEVLKALHSPTLFWLDGHYSKGITARGTKDTPIIEELESIFRHKAKGHVILIDDARCFTGAGDYPSIEELRRLVNERAPGTRFEAADDIIRIHP